MGDYFDQADWYRQYLSDGENVRWTGKPEMKIGFQPIYLFLIPFFTVWFGGVLTATVSSIAGAVNGESDLFMLFFMIPFWAGGGFFVYMLFILPYLQRKHTRYAVTDKKVVEEFRGKVKMINLDPTPLIQLSVINKRGCGSISIGGTYNAAGYATTFFSSPWQNQGSIVIMNIKEPAKVYDLLTDKTGK